MKRSLSPRERRLEREAADWTRRVPPGTPVAVRLDEEGHEWTTRTRSAALIDAGVLEVYVEGRTSPVGIYRIRPLATLRPRRVALGSRLAPALP